GTHRIIGGAEGDTILTGTGANLVFGDNAALTFDAAGALARAASTATGQGGADRISTGTGTHMLIGGADADVIETGSGGHLIFGDSAELILANGLVTRATSLAAGTGGVDPITTGHGKPGLPGAA